MWCFSVKKADEEILRGRIILITEARLKFQPVVCWIAFNFNPNETATAGKQTKPKQISELPSSVSSPRSPGGKRRHHWQLGIEEKCQLT
ncbi:uncharacterized [Tachysurus ichikawai]